MLDAATCSVIINPRSLHFKFISIHNNYQHLQNISQSYAIAKQDNRDKCIKYLVADYWSAEGTRETWDCSQPAGSLKEPTHQIWMFLGNQICLDCQCQYSDSQNWSMYCQSNKNMQNKLAHQCYSHFSIHTNSWILKYADTFPPIIY